MSIERTEQMSIEKTEHERLADLAEALRKAAALYGGSELLEQMAVRADEMSAACLAAHATNCFVTPRKPN